MEDKDFDKIFARKFGQATGEPYKEAGWSDLSGRMDAHERRRKRTIIPVIWPLFGLLATSNVFWWHQWQQAKKQSAGVAQQEIRIPSDTLVRKTVIYDTVYQYVTIIKQHIQEDNAAMSAAVFSGKNTPQTIAFENQKPVNEPVLDETSGNNTKSSISATAANLSDQKNGTDKTAVPEAGHSISYRVPVQDTFGQTLATIPESGKQAAADTVFEQLLHTPPDIKKVHTPLLMFARPRLGVQAGWSNPMLTHKRSGTLFGAGLGADVAVARNIRLGADAQYWSGRLKADETDELTAVDIPDPGSDYKLRYWETYKLPVVSYALHLKYYFPSKSAWVPWVGIGTQWATVLPFEIEFDYENQTSHYEVFLPGQTRAITHWQGLAAMAGVEKQWNTHFSFGADAFLLQHTGKNPGILGRQFGLKTRVYYHF